MNVEPDEISEGDETFFSEISTNDNTISSGVDVSIGVDNSTVTIVDNDVIRCGFSPVDYPTSEMENATLMIVCSGVAAFDYVVMVTTQQQTAMGESPNTVGWSGWGQGYSGRGHLPCDDTHLYCHMIVM